jgi:hypothetical protein
MKLNLYFYNERSLEQVATQFSKNKMFCHKFPFFSLDNYLRGSKFYFLKGWVLPHLCLLSII